MTEKSEKSVSYREGLRALAILVSLLGGPTILVGVGAWQIFGDPDLLPVAILDAVAVIMVWVATVVTVWVATRAVIRFSDAMNRATGREPQE